jgi:hypothetical protein
VCLFDNYLVKPYAANERIEFQELRSLDSIIYDSPNFVTSIKHHYLSSLELDLNYKSNLLA